VLLIQILNEKFFVGKFVRSESSSKEVFRIFEFLDSINSEF